MIRLLDYQKDAVAELYERLSKMLRSDGKKTCVFKAPTGSGKTIVVANLLRRLAREKNNIRMSVIWIAPRKLHDQSKEKLERIYSDHAMRCSNFEDLQDNQIEQNEILFFNWESITKKNNIYIMDNERDRNLSTVIKNTRSEGRKLVLVIDESHYAAKGEKSKELIHDMSPDVTLEVSATPNLKEFDDFYPVYLDRVKEEEMIKNDILVNPEFMQLKVGSKDSDTMIIEQALRRREHLKKGFESEGSKVNPLMLVQIPDRKALMDDKRDTVVEILRDHGITEDNGKLAIWLSEEKSDTLPNIEEPDNEVEVLVFKQAISIGWDCPRASILVIFRDYTSFEFTIQTVGRIMRMPEQRHYKKVPELNSGYIFTNLEKIDLTAEYVKGYASQYESHRNESAYEPIRLRSTYTKRQRERTRLSGKFVKIFNDPSVTGGLKAKISASPKKIVKPLVSDGMIYNIDEAGYIETKGMVNTPATEKQIYYRFDDFVRSACSPFAPHDSSHSLKTALYKFVHDNLGIKEHTVEAQQIVLGSENHHLFRDAINQAKMKYQRDVVDGTSKKRFVEETTEWEVPKTMSFGDGVARADYETSIMKPFYHAEMSDPETKFVERLSASAKITWWYKNGESEKKYFAVPYTDENGYCRDFYVDFIIQFSDGRIGMFDTKGGITASAGEVRYKHDGLYKYILCESKKGKRLFGGIAVEKDGTWRYYDKKKYRFDENNMLDWKILDL